ncbi:hypothetical protein KC19_VG325700 [Ceratodon purpureus]|uniref:Secreted protein n=1 Tax=Ceratodon purpureus TaxID=3225 RepID=A0A8T0HXJ7_CERPU|nr:hypothetical protein KC19_VG325700 [Ceratodon purpureus]
MSMASWVSLFSGFQGCSCGGLLSGFCWRICCRIRRLLVDPGSGLGQTSTRLIYECVMSHGLEYVLPGVAETVAGMGWFFCIEREMVLRLLVFLRTVGWCCTEISVRFDLFES